MVTLHIHEWSAVKLNREQAAILLSLAVAVSSIFITLRLKNQVTAYQSQVELLQTINVNNSLKLLELQQETSEYKSRIIELQNEVDRNKRIVNTWRTYRDRLQEALVENARLKGRLLERELDTNLTTPTVEPRRDKFYIGDTVTFDIASETPLYGSYFEVRGPEGNVIWEGDPIGNWAEIGVYGVDPIWVVPYVGQTAYLDPMLLEEDMPLGEWTWSYRFSDLVHVEGTFTVEEPPQETTPETG